MNMNRDDYICDIEISYNHTKLLNEVKDVPLWPYGRNMPWKDSWFHGPTTWLYGDIDTITPELDNVISLLCDLFACKDIRPHLHKQLKGSSVPFHTDKLPKIDRDLGNDVQPQCAVNLQLGNEIGPVEFENIGNVGSYRCALLNVYEKHSVPAFHEDRFFIKFKIIDCSFEDARDKYCEIRRKINI